MAPSLDVQRYAPLLVVLAVVAIAGATIFFGLQNPKKQPPVPPRAPQAPQTAGGDLPSDHPPLEIPAQVKEAIARLEGEAAKAPEDLEKWRHLGEVQYRAAQIDKAFLEPARQSYAHILEKSPDDLDTLRSLGNIAFDQERPKEAIGFYERFLKQKPNDLEVRTDIGTMHLAAGDTEEAVRTYEKVLNDDPSFFQAQFNLAIAYRSAGQNEAAVRALQKSVEIAPDDTAREQVKQLLAHVQGQPPPAAPAAAPAAGTSSDDGFQTAIENIFRQNQIMASKVQRIEWSGPNTARLYLNDFPMQAMGEQMQTMFVDRMRGRFKEQKEAHGVSDTTTVELIDNASGEVMGTITE